MHRQSILTTKTFLLLTVSLMLALAAWLLLINQEYGRLKNAAQERDQARAELKEIDAKQQLLGQAEERYQVIKDDLQKIKIAIPEASDTGLFVAALEQLASEKGVTIDSIATDFKSKTAGTTSETKNDDTANTEQSSQSKNKQATAKTLEEQLLAKYYATSFDIKLTGSYQNIHNFVLALLQFERLVILNNLNFTVKSDNADAVAATLDFWIYHQSAAKKSD